MNILALDFGLSRVGVAVGSTDSGIAFARKVLKNDQHLFDNLEDMVNEDFIDHIVVGMPYMRDGKHGDIYDKLMDFVEELKERFKLEVELHDERYSSKIAEHRQKQVAHSRSARRDFADDLAAQVILQDWLERQQS